MRLAVMVLLILAATEAYCCKCNGPGDVNNSLKQSDIVVVGRVLEVSYVGLADSMHPDSALIAQKLLKEKEKAS